MKRALSLILTALMILSLSACTNRRDMMEQQAEENTPNTSMESNTQRESSEESSEAVETNASAVEDGFILIKGGSFLMGSPDTEDWRSEDEFQHEVSVSDFYMSPYELTQAEYEKIVGSDPSSFDGETSLLKM